MVNIWAGIDAGKREHHCVVIEGDGTQLLSRCVANDEETVLGLIAEVCARVDGGQVTWAIDLNSSGATPVLTLLADHDQHVFYIPGRIIHHGAAGNAKSPTWRSSGRSTPNHGPVHPRSQHQHAAITNCVPSRKCRGGRRSP